MGEPKFLTLKPVRVGSLSFFSQARECNDGPLEWNCRNERVRQKMYSTQSYGSGSTYQAVYRTRPLDGDGGFGGYCPCVVMDDNCVTGTAKEDPVPGPKPKPGPKPGPKPSGGGKPGGKAGGSGGTIAAVVVGVLAVGGVAWYVQNKKQQEDGAAPTAV